MQTPQEARKSTLNEIYIEVKNLLNNCSNLQYNIAYAEVLYLIDEKLKEME